MPVVKIAVCRYIRIRGAPDLFLGKHKHEIRTQALLHPHAVSPDPLRFLSVVFD
jgi:hypothetical protein